MVCVGLCRHLNKTKTIFMITFQQPQILVLKEGTDQSQGKPQLISNINACQLVVDAVSLYCYFSHRYCCSAFSTAHVKILQYSSLTNPLLECLDYGIP